MIQLGCVSVGRAAGTTGKTHDHFYSEHAPPAARFLRKVSTSRSARALRRDDTGLPWQLERRYLNVAVFKFLFPGFGLGWIVEQIFDRAMALFGIAAGADLHRFQAEGADFVEHFVEGKWS